MAAMARSSKIRYVVLFVIMSLGILSRSVAAYATAESLVAPHMPLAGAWHLTSKSSAAHEHGFSHAIHMIRRGRRESDFGWPPLLVDSPRWGLPKKTCRMAHDVQFWIMHAVALQIHPPS
jgi:hypothetical protein